MARKNTSSTSGRTEEPSTSFPQNHEPDDFFDTSPGSVNRSRNNTSSSTQHYPPSSDRFIFDGDTEEDAAFISSSPASRYLVVMNDQQCPRQQQTTMMLNEPLLRGSSHHHDDEESRRNLRLPFVRLRRPPSQPSPILSGINILNLTTFAAVLVVSILWGSGLVETIMHNHGYPWLPSPWTVTQTGGYETLLLTPDWAGQYIWIPVIVFEGLFSLVQLLPTVRNRPEVGSGVGYCWFYIGMLHILSIIFFCLRWIIPAWFALAINGVFLLLLQYQLREINSLVKITEWEYWVFQFPFDLHLGWLLPLLASRGSMIFRCYGRHNVGLQLAADIVCLALLLPCAGACLTRGQGPPDWVVPILILWAYIGVGCRLFYAPDSLVNAYGNDIIVSVRDSAWAFAVAVGCMVIPNAVVWVAREFLTIRVVQLDEEEEDEEEVQGLVTNAPSNRDINLDDFDM